MEMSLLTVGVFGTSQKKLEKRVPIHPKQIGWLDEGVRKKLIFEKEYGKRFGVTDDEIASQTGGVATRENLFQECDIVLLAKPTPLDFRQMKEGTIHFGWPHCVQQHEMTQIAIDRRLTLIAWEAMHRWSKHGDWQMHVFHKNNEIAGYAGVLHAMNLMGTDGNYGAPKNAAVISFGSVSRGAVRALQSRGIQHITVYTQRYSFLVADQMAGVEYFQYDDSINNELSVIEPNGNTYPLIQALEDKDIIVNGILQNTDKPLMFVNENQINQLKKGALIIDVSCDEGMGFYFAKPTSFDKPIFDVKGIHYYGVDHTPSYLWDAASWEISNSLTPYLPIIMGGTKKWKTSETIKRAIEIQEGVIKNESILSFQNRSKTYPHQIHQKQMN